MKFALVDNERQQAKQGISGKCISCGDTMVARCGEVRVHHWAHKGRIRCDPWWENETEWHRSWKNEFPNHWQEVVHYADNGEKHIADIKTEANWIIEFQHSYIKPQERRSREDFYKNLIWIVDGNRRIKDKKRFFEVIGDDIRRKGYSDLKETFPEGALFRDWINSTTHVFFDFGEDDLWWLFPQSNEYYAYVLQMARQQFIRFHSEKYLSGEGGFENLFKKYNLKPTNPLKSPTSVASTTDIGNIHPNSLLLLLNNRRRSRL